MKKISKYSLIIGIGLGIIITSIFNILWMQAKAVVYENKENIYNIPTVDNDTKDSPFMNITGENLDNTFDNIDDTSEYLDEESYHEIFISQGMQSEGIAYLLESEGIIKNKEEFNNLSIKLGVTRKFQSGVRLIPINSSMEEIISILTEKQ